MKIINGFNLTKAIFPKAALLGLAAAAFMAAPQKASAQVAIGIHFGHRPVYAAPVPAYVPAYNQPYIADYGFYPQATVVYGSDRRDWNRREFDHRDFDHRENFNNGRHFDDRNRR